MEVNCPMKTCRINTSMVIMNILLLCFISRGLCRESDGATKDSIRLREDAFIDNLEEKVRSTLMFGGSSPISFSGEGRIKLQYHSLADPPLFMEHDKSWIQSGWEGNEGLLRLGMIMSLGRNVRIFSKIGFQHTLPGNYIDNEKSKQLEDSSGFTPLQNRHDKLDDPAYIHEDLYAGVALRTKPASVMLKFGGLQWIEASPLTIWKYEQRMFAWDYLPFEVEESIADYYVKNLIEGERTGRAAWPKKPFNGIGLESINLPWNLLTDFFYGSFETFDRHEREYVHLQDDRSYYSEESEAKGRGIGDSYRHVFFGRLAIGNFFGKLTPGINVVTVRYDEDVAGNEMFRQAYGIAKSGDSAFYKEPLILSTDLRGRVGDHLSLHADIACSRIDTTLLFYSSDKNDSSSEHRRSPRRLAMFVSVEDDHLIPLRLDLFGAARGFYSPFSFAKSVDAFFPFSANLVGPGEKFIASGYTQNMAGFNCTVSPLRMDGNGHCRITYGNHLQLKKGPDVIFFPYRLNGADLYSIFQSSYSRWGLNLLDFRSDVGKDTYGKRLGDESFDRSAYGSPSGPEAGGIRSHYLSLYEGFVPYVDSASAAANSRGTANVFQRSTTVPQHRKFTFNLDLDAAYDLSSLPGWRKSLLVAVYAQLNGISTVPRGIITNKKSDATMLWGALVRCESAFALNEDLYLLGCVGFENWYADKAWMAMPEVKHVPIDYREFAYGLGGDWQMLERVSLHLRCKWMKHLDVYCQANNWETPIISGELKMWF
jgi:hypothetical protein